MRDNPPTEASQGNFIQTIPNSAYCFGTLNPSQDNTEKMADSSVVNPPPNIEKGFHFFSSSEARLCLEITQAIKKNHQTIFVELPSFAQDTALAQRIGDYIKIPKSHSVVIDAKGLNATQILKEYIKQLSLDTDNDVLFQEFAKLMTYYFQHNQVLHSVIYNAQFLQKQDFDYLYELGNLIYEKFPKERHKPLIRFIFIGNKLVSPILRKKTNGHFKHVSLPVLTHTDCVNALYLYTPLLERSQSFYQTVANNAVAVRTATAGYPALLRHVLPFPIAPSLADKKNPEGYLTRIIDNKIDVMYHTELSKYRLQLRQNNAQNRQLGNRADNKIIMILLGLTMLVLSGYFLL